MGKKIQSEKEFDDELAKLSSGISKQLEKPKKEKGKDMKNLKNNQTIKTVLTVLLTLIAVAAIAISFKLGMDHQKSVDSAMNEQLKEIVSSIKVSEPKK